MLSDHKLEALGDIERRLGWDSRELTRFFSTVEPPSAKSRRKRARARMLVAAAVLAGVVLLGPRMLTEAEVKTRKSPPRREHRRPSPPSLAGRVPLRVPLPRSLPRLPSICSLVPQQLSQRRHANADLRNS